MDILVIKGEKMGTHIIEICPKCGKECEQEWQIDMDSESGEPHFYKICHNCGWEHIE